ncbi:unnamed protein product, partial [marine sediment metagenome]
NGIEKANTEVISNLYSLYSINFLKSGKYLLVC